MNGTESRRARRNGINLGTSLTIVAAIAAECALVVQIKRCYEAIPSYESPVCPEEYAILAVLLWVVLGSLAAFAIRKYSLTQLAALVAISCVLVLSRLSVPTRTGALSAIYPIGWPIACFGLCIVAPYLLIRRSGTNNSALLLADSAVVALLTYVLAIEPYVPRL
jgi:cytochrome bd-type quinol oxidase subunit 2